MVNIHTPDGGILWCFEPGYTVDNCPAPLVKSCPNSTVAGPAPCSLQHNPGQVVKPVSVQDGRGLIAVPHAGLGLPPLGTGLELLLMGAGLILAALWRGGRL